MYEYSELGVVIPTQMNVIICKTNHDGIGRLFKDAQFGLYCPVTLAIKINAIKACSDFIIRLFKLEFIGAARSYLSNTKNGR